MRSDGVTRAFRCRACNRRRAKLSFSRQPTNSVDGISFKYTCSCGVWTVVEVDDIHAILSSVQSLSESSNFL